MLNLFSCSLFTFVVPTVPGNTTEDLLTINIGILYDLYCWMLIGSGKILYNSQNYRQSDSKNYRQSYNQSTTKLQIKTIVHE
jgi:hypothetical protein